MIFTDAISYFFGQYTDTDNHFTNPETLYEVNDSGFKEIFVEGSLRAIIEKLQTFPLMTKFFSDEPIDFTKLAYAFSQIGRFFRIKFPVLDVSISNSESESNSSQTITVTSFAEIFQQIKSMNVHQNVNSDNHDVAYPKVVKEPVCQCAYHEEELFDHLHICAIVAGIVAIRENHNVFNAMLTALFHDIGKPSCIRIFDKGHVGYPYHGEYGSMILSRLYNSNFAKFISKTDYEIMCRTISIHMCSYHMTDFQSNWNQDRANSTRAESDSVKQMLKCLSYGDVFAAFSPMNNSDNFISTRKEYSSLISIDYVSDRNKYVFVMNGRSGSGKSYMADILSTFAKTLGKSVNHIQRDIIISNVVRAAQGLDEITHRPTSEEYESYHQYYRQNKLGTVVNERFKTLFQNSINMFDVTIIDTQLTMFRGVEQIVPSNINKCIIISFDVSRNLFLQDDSKNGIFLTSQLAMFGKSNALSPFDLTGVQLSNMASAYTHNSRPIGFAPDFVFALGYNQDFNGDNTIGLDYFKEFFTKMISTLIGTSTLINTDNMNIVEYVNHLYQTNENSYDAICQILRTQYYHVGSPHFLKDTPYEKNFLSIKYLDHNNNWNTWGRETRGTTLVLTDGKWKMFKYLMQRGAEMLTGMQVMRGIDKTDNVDTSLDWKASHLSQDQQNLINDLRIGNPINLAVSFKKDGSLLSCCLYTGEYAKLMREIITNHGDKFAKIVMQTYDEANNSSDNSSADVFVFQSQTTLLIGDAMQDYTTTAIFPEADPKLSPNKKIQTYGPDFFKRIYQMFKSIPGSIKHIIGETICANRTESFSGKVHTELAVSYPVSSFTILSITSIFEDSYKVMPHYHYSDLIFQNGFTEPAYWMVDTVAQVDALIQGVDFCIFQKMTCDEFYQQFKPTNKYCYTKVMDYEGFVTYDLNRCDSYGKIKTDSYYKSHKLRNDNIGFLCDLSKVAGHIFPLARIVSETITSLNTKLNLINDDLISIISSEEMISHLPAKASNGFAQRPRQLQFKIIINNAKDVFGTKGFSVFQKYFPSIQMSEDMKSLIVSYSMKTELWLSEPKPLDDKFRNELVYQLIGMSVQNFFYMFYMFYPLSP